MSEAAGPPSRRGWHRRRWLVGAALGPVLSLQAPLARAAAVLAVRVWPAQSYTRIALELDEDLKHSELLVADPPRLVVDLDGLELDDALRDLVAKVRTDDPFIRSLRVGQFRPKVVRLVFDLKQEIAPQVFTLAPVGPYGHRLLIDLHPAIDDPLQTLLRQLQQRPPGAGAAPAPTAEGNAPARGGAGIGQDPHTGSAGTTQAAGPGSQASPMLRPTPPARGGARPPATDRLVTIAIDPGHGGEDPGAIGKGGTREKDVVLAIAQKLAARIAQEPNMRAFLTRDADYFVPLAVRVQRARAAQADLFVSIHADAFVRPQARGASVFVLSEGGASSSAARWLADRENRADLIGGVNLGGRNREVARLLLQLSTETQIRDSSHFARIVLGQLGAIGELHKRGVEQAGFAVLKAPDIPSVLVETAFISNPHEERRLADPEYQNRIAKAIHTGIRHYFIKHPVVARQRAT